jgi:hypothetical protein
MLRQSTESFFRLEFYKTPTVISNTGTTLTCEPPTRQNRRFVSSKNLSLPLGEKFLYTSTTSSFYIHIPVFTGSNYRNKENMYLFWFDDESNLEDINLSGTVTLDKYSFTATTVQTILFTNENNVITQINIPTGTTSLIGWTGQTFNYPNLSYEVLGNTNDKPGQKTPFYHGMNTFFMTAKFFNGKDGSILDFTNYPFSTTHVITEENDMYYQVDFDHYERTYQIYEYSDGAKGKRVGISNSNLTTTIDFYEKGGGTVPVIIPTPTPTPTPSPVNFNVSNTCVGQIGYITISGGTGGSGTYQYNQYYYPDEITALGTTTGYTTSTGATWSNIPDGTWYFVMRDNTTLTNKIVKSAVVSCDSNPPSCVTGVTFNVIDTPLEVFYIDCTGDVQSVMYETTGSKTIADCLQVNSLSSPNEEDYNTITYASTTCT